MAKSPISELKTRELTLDGIIRANVGIVSNDSVFIASANKELPNHGFKINLSRHEDLSQFGAVPNEIYLIDLYGVSDNDYSRLINLITALKRKNPEGKFVLLPTDTQLYSATFDGFRKVRNILDEIPKRPESPTTNGNGDYLNGMGGFINVEIIDILNKLVSKPDIIKIGGSIFDMVSKTNNAAVLEQLLREIGDLHQMHPMILTSGGGPRQGIEKSLNRQLQLSESDLEGYSRGVLESQAKTLESYLKKIGIEAVYVPPNDLRFLDVSGNYLRKYLPVVALSNGGSIPASESDTHTLSIADHFHIKEVRFVKNTDGIYLWDPNVRRHTLMDLIRKLKEGEFKKISDVFGSRNELIPRILASDILGGKISRYGLENDGNLSDDHIVETGALRYLLETAKYVERIHIISGIKPGILKSALEGKEVGSYILKG